jgi:spore maturation protein CgeB
MDGEKPSRFNVRNRQRRKLYNLEDASFEELDEEDQCMLILEDDFTEEEKFVYFQEVEHEMAALIHVLENDEETKN